MLTIKQTKNIQGKIELSPSCELFILTTVIAIAKKQPVAISPYIKSEFLNKWAEIIKEFGTTEWGEKAAIFKPYFENSPLQVIFNFPLYILYRDLIIFAFLGMGKEVCFCSLSERRISYWEEQAKRLGFTLDIEKKDNNLVALKIKDIPSVISFSKEIDECDIQPLLGFLLGSNKKASFNIGYIFSSPLREVAPLFGDYIEVKNSKPKPQDELLRRIELMNRKSNKEGSGVQFTVTVDFSVKENKVKEDVINIILPGDELIASAFTAAATLFPKNTLVISNFPLESWASPVLGFIRKYGVKVSIQESGRTSFGSVGMVSIRATGEFTGKKSECFPAIEYILTLPSMLVIASFAEGESVFRCLEELRFDNPDLLEEIEKCLDIIGVHHGEMPDGIVLKGGKDYDGFDITDRITPQSAIAFAVAGLRCIGNSTINDELLKERLPNFGELLNSVCQYRD
ncbi:MAG: hypothetical protein N2053_09125 [Chitinispirillaceae bacterium]|nr:hypothetical protein [Chitinispirillaceae bacterium]